MLSDIPNLYSYTDPDYLDANRRGEITEEQIQLLGPAREFLIGKFQRKGRLNGTVIIITLLVFALLQVLGIELTAPLVGGLFGLALVVLAVQLGSRQTRSRRQRVRLEEDLHRGMVQEGVGTLKFQGNTYSAVLPDRQLRLPFGGREELAPGAQYRFYYLPNSGMVLSAEPLGEIPEDAVESGLTAVLAKASGFQLSSLSANRQGNLAAEQISGLAGQLVAPLLFLLVSGGIIYIQLRRGGYLNAGSLLGMISQLSDSMTRGMMVAGGILLVLFLTGLALLVLTLLDMFGGSVKYVEGIGYRKITTSQDDDGTQTRRYYYLIGGKRFRANDAGFQAFEDGLKYRAYYTPLRKILVNLEVLE
ncbi:MAG: hypothetical protein P8Y37_07900 [Anaerolineales bacterium]